ncbi:MAG: DMT family transporter, partial [Pseudomonadota bacterium]
ISRQLNFRIPRQDRGRLVIRSIAEASVGALYLAALFNMPIANAVAILQVSPLAVAFGAYLFLGEPLGRRRLWAIAIGFVGVMLIVRPGLDGFNIYSLCAMAGIVALATRDLITRTMTSNLPTLTVATTGSAAVTVLAGTGMLFSDWTPLEPASVVRLGSAVVWLMLAYFFAIAVMRIGEIGFVAPFRYTGLLAAIIAGIIVFREWPDAWMLLGSAIIVTTGLYLTYRESLET